MFQLVPINEPVECHKHSFFQEWFRTTGFFDKRTFAVVCCRAEDLDRISKVYKPAGSPQLVQDNQLTYKVYMDKWYETLAEDLRMLLSQTPLTFQLHFIGDLYGEVFGEHSTLHPEYTFEIVNGKLQHIFTDNNENMKVNMNWECPICTLNFLV